MWQVCCSCRRAPGGCWPAARRTRLSWLPRDSGVPTARRCWATVRLRHGLHSPCPCTPYAAGGLPALSYASSNFTNLRMTGLCLTGRPNQRVRVRVTWGGGSGTGKSGARGSAPAQQSPKTDRPNLRVRVGVTGGVGAAQVIQAPPVARPAQPSPAFSACSSRSQSSSAASFLLFSSSRALTPSSTSPPRSSRRCVLFCGNIFRFPGPSVFFRIGCTRGSEKFAAQASAL